MTIALSDWRYFRQFSLWGLRTDNVRRLWNVALTLDGFCGRLLEIPKITENGVVQKVYVALVGRFVVFLRFPLVAVDVLGI